ncbi:MAG: hypothetical protein JXA54_02905 [Candidatus Heimdallarchaeota archaeon]|nr:hypothetical protein [Candidatus Heimdallarchaeota archaeon]
MNEKNTIPRINFKTHLILFFITGGLWIPVYNFICLGKLNQLARIKVPEPIPSIRNRSIGLFFISLTFIGTFYVIYRRFQLLHNYIEKLESYLPVRPVDIEKDEHELSIKLNCLKPIQFVGFIVTTILMIGILVSTFTLSIYHLIDPTWGSNALMILFPIGMGSIFTSLGFCIRTIKEESNWVKAFNTIAIDVSNMK